MLLKLLLYSPVYVEEKLNHLIICTFVWFAVPHNGIKNWSFPLVCFEGEK